MTPRQLKRLEHYIRVLKDTSATPNEHRMAAELALDIVVKERSHASAGEWSRFRTMSYFECCVCGEDINPVQLAWKNNGEYRHDKCHLDSVESEPFTPPSK